MQKHQVNIIQPYYQKKVDSKTATSVYSLLNVRGFIAII